MKVKVNAISKEVQEKAYKVCISYYEEDEATAMRNFDRYCDENNIPYNVMQKISAIAQEEFWK